MLTFLTIYYIGMNFIGILAMFIDKRRARKHQYRIQEKTLWFIAVIGGAIGSTLGMALFRHKTKHLSFKWGFPLLSIMHIILISNFLFV